MARRTPGFAIPSLVLGSLVTGALTSAARAQPAPPAPEPAPQPAEPPQQPGQQPWPPPGYARWNLPPPAPSDSYLNDLPPETEGRHTGFFMRMSLGPGYYSMQSHSSDGQIALRAAGAGLNLTLGGAIQEDFVVHGEVSLQSTLDPKVNATEAAGVYRQRTGTSVTTAGLGAGAGYYFMPINIYLGASLLVAQARAVDRPTERLLGKTELGPALAVTVDKEWWMSPTWSLGVLGRAQLARFKDSSHGRIDTMWNALWLSLAFSVTFE
jgi:hypothetical protein